MVEKGEEVWGIFEGLGNFIRLCGDLFVILQAEKKVCDRCKRLIFSGGEGLGESCA